MYGPVGAGILEKKGVEGDILGPLFHNLQLAMTDPISRGDNLACGPTPPSILARGPITRRVVPIPTKMPYYVARRTHPFPFALPLSRPLSYWPM